MFALAEAGYDSLFEQLVACILSIRTYDEVSLVAAQRLFAMARTPDEIAASTPAALDGQIADTTFHERKAAQIHAIAATVVLDHGGHLPRDRATLLAFAGVGPKCANLALGVSSGRWYQESLATGEGNGDVTLDERLISVDIHVHRVTNRWGYVATPTPEHTMVALQAVLPPRYDVAINELLVPFGKHICTGIRPKCSTCPVLDMCQQVGVTSHR